MRTMPSVSPIFARRSGGTDACVIDAAEAFCERHQTDAVAYLVRRVLAPDVEGEHAAETSHLTRGQCVLGV